jgi:hypothetical protein
MSAAQVSLSFAELPTVFAPEGAPPPTAMDFSLAAAALLDTCAASPRSLSSSRRASAGASFPRSCRSRPTNRCPARSGLLPIGAPY